MPTETRKKAKEQKAGKVMAATNATPLKSCANKAIVSFVALTRTLRLRLRAAHGRRYIFQV